MLRVLDELLWSLRREGFAISTAQAIDAARAAALVGFESKTKLRAAIAAVVVERRADERRFAVTFDRFFSPDRARPDDLFGRLRDRGFSEAEVDALRELLLAAAERSGLGDAGAVAALVGTEGELDRLLASAGIKRALAPMTSPLQAGFFAHRVVDALRIPKLASALQRMRDALREALGEQRGTELSAAVVEELENIRQRVRNYVEESLRRKLDESDGGARRKLEGRPFVTLTDVEIEHVRRAVRRLAERLRGAERVRRRHARHGRIDVRRTLRLCLGTGGVAFAPARQAKRRDKPKLVVLCDISESVRTASLFMLEFVYAAQELFAGTRSFVFVSDLGETTALFAREPVRKALAEVYGGGIVSSAHNSNYGRVLRTFEDRFARSIDRRTTIVILGDGRTNYHADEAAIVSRLRERARALLWVCPEPELAWGAGDSAMQRYAAASTKVLWARTAAELEAAAREVVARRK